jgi:hypothetical protein
VHGVPRAVRKQKCREVVEAVVRVLLVRGSSRLLGRFLTVATRDRCPRLSRWQVSYSADDECRLGPLDMLLEFAAQQLDTERLGRRDGS